MLEPFGRPQRGAVLSGLSSFGLALQPSLLALCGDYDNAADTRSGWQRHDDDRIGAAAGSHLRPSLCEWEGGR